jgi:hypothetical protein
VLLDGPDAEIEPACNGFVAQPEQNRAACCLAQVFEGLGKTKIYELQGIAQGSAGVWMVDTRGIADGRDPRPRSSPPLHPGRHDCCRPNSAIRARSIDFHKADFRAARLAGDANSPTATTRE